MKLPTLDQRGAILTAVFFFGFLFPSEIMGVIAFKPDLLDNSAFMTFATALMTASLGSGGVGTIVGWAFGATKSGSETASKLADSVTLNPGSNPVPEAVIPPVVDGAKVVGV